MWDEKGISRMERRRRLKKLGDFLKKAAISLCVVFLLGCAVKKGSLGAFDLAGKELEIAQLKESVTFLEALTENYWRDLEKLQKKVTEFLSYPHTCKHKGLLR